MNKLMHRTTLAAIALSALGWAASALAETIVGFDVSKVEFKDMEEPASYVEIDRAKDVDKNSQQCWNFDTTKPLFNQGVPIYGGINELSNNTTLDPAASIVRLHTNKPDGWPNKPMLFFDASDTSEGANSYNVNAIFVWKKADFAGVKKSQKVKCDATSSLHVQILDWNSQEGGKPIDIRFVVKNGAKYYVSEASASAAESTLDLADFNDSKAEGKRWAEFKPTATDFGLPDKPAYVAVDFDDVQEVGIIGQGSGAYLRMYGFDKFSATATVVGR